MIEALGNQSQPVFTPSLVTLVTPGCFLVKLSQFTYSCHDVWVDYSVTFREVYRMFTAAVRTSQPVLSESWISPEITETCTEKNKKHILRIFHSISPDVRDAVQCAIHVHG